MKKLLMFLMTLLVGASGAHAFVIYYDNSETNWTTPYLYVFTSEKNLDMTLVKGNIWKYETTETPDERGFLFRSGKEWGDEIQTPDIKENNTDVPLKDADGWLIKGYKKSANTSCEITKNYTPGGGDPVTTHTVTIKWDSSWDQNKALTYDSTNDYYYITGTAGTDIPGAGTQFALTCDGKDYSAKQEMTVNEKYNAIADNSGNNFTYPTGYTDVTIYFDYNNGTPQVWFTGTPEGTTTPDTTKWGLFEGTDNTSGGSYEASTKFSDPDETGITTFYVSVKNGGKLAFYNENGDKYLLKDNTTNYGFNDGWNDKKELDLTKVDGGEGYFTYTGSIADPILSGKIYKVGSTWTVDINFIKEANVYLRKYNSDWNTGDKFERQADGITYVLNNVDMADGWYKIYDENQTNEDGKWKGYDSAISDTQALLYKYETGEATTNNFKLKDSSKKVNITYWSNTGTFKIDPITITEAPTNFGILVGSTPVFENSLQFTKADGSDVWTLTAENVQINNGSAIYILDNNSNRWWIDGQDDFRIYGDVTDKALTNAGTKPAPARFHMASAKYTIKAQITMNADGTYNLDYVKFSRKKGNVTTPDGWQWGLAFQDLNVTGKWSWTQIENNAATVPLFDLGTAEGDGAKAYVFKKTLTLTQGKFFSIYSKKGEVVKQWNFGPESTNYTILNNRNLLRLNENDIANTFGLGTAEYEVTMEVWQEDNETWYCRFEFGGNAEPNTIYLALSKETPQDVLDADKANLSIYAYTNGSDATNAITNGTWPGLKEWTLDQTVSDVVGVPVYKATVKPRFLRFIASVDGANQTNNLKIVNNGVYFWNDELLPFGVILYGDDGKPVYRRYSNTQSEETTKYVYLPASEFGLTKNEDGTYPLVYVNVYDKTTGQQVSGLRGTTTAIPEEYHGVLYYKVPTASIAEGSEIEIEFNRDGGDKNNWNGTCPHCGKTYKDVKDHSACYTACKDENEHDANQIIITYPDTETVKFEEGMVFHRYPAKPTNILTDTKPTTLKLCINGEEKDATREDNGTYYFDGEYAVSTPYYFKATFGTDENATTSYYGAAAADYQQFKTVPYSIYEVAKTKSANSWLLPTDEGFTFNVVLSWSEQKTWSRINATKAFGSLVGAQDPIDAVPYASAERTAIAATYTSHASFIDETKHFGNTTVSMRQANNSEYVRPAHTAAVDPATGDNSDQTYTKSGVIKVAAHSAGKYTLRVNNPASAEFDLQVLTTEVTVRPTIESVGLQINGFDVEKENGAYTIFLKDDGEDEFEMNGYTHSNKRAHVGCSEELIAHKTGLPDNSALKGQMIWDAMKACNIKVYFKYADAAANEPAYRPAAREAAAASTVPAGYTEYGARGVELDMTKAKANGGISFIIEENGVQSTPVDISAANFSVPTGIDEIGEEEAAEPVYFDLQGFPVKNPEKGIYIRVINGKADKVLF